nr:jerky protein homolog-like [Hydra vulgaris]
MSPITIGKKKYSTETIVRSFEYFAISRSLYGRLSGDYGLPKKKGVIIPQFKNSFPDSDWIRSFLKRNLELSVRFASNIKRKRAEIGTTVIDNYFINLSNETSNISPDNIWNYDETNLSDDPGKKKKILTKRGCKYPERIINSTKTSFSVMLCGNANGELLPSYVVYKAESLWNTWIENGPPKASYNRSKSGWFDSTCFKDWFFSLLLPRLKKAQGRSVIIGDNVSSHLSIAILDTCQSNNIGFAALPANSTHLTQPLDVAYFRSMKINRRKILCEWKEKGKGRRVASLPKHEFPRLLDRLITNLNEHGNDNLRAGFCKTGIFPLDKSQVLSRLPCCNVGLGSTTDLVANHF